MRSGVYVTVGCPSVRPSVCPVDRQQQRRAASWSGRLQQMSIDSWQACSPRSAANAGSVMLRADGRGSTQTCLLLLNNLAVIIIIFLTLGRYVPEGV